MKHLLPGEAWDFLKRTKDARFIDVRREIESLYVGRPPGVVSIPWYEHPGLQPGPASSAATAKRELDGDNSRSAVLLRCGGQVTIDAGMALEQPGLTGVPNVLQGFEGDLNEQFHHSTRNDWRHDGLSWEQM